MWAPGFGELIIIAVICGTPALLIVFIMLYMLHSGKERKRLREEVGQLASEVRLMHQALDKEQNATRETNDRE